MASLANATNLINLYCGSLRNVFAQHNAVYTFKESPSGFTCELDLPFNSPVRRSSSMGFFPSKKMAKASAALSAVEQLILAGEFDADLKPTPANPAKKRGEAQPDNAGAEKKPTVEDQRNAARAQLDSQKENGAVGYEMYKSLLWSHDWKPIGNTTKLHGLEVSLVVDGPATVPECRTLVFLTAEVFPVVTIDVSLHGTSARVELKPTRTFKLSPGQREEAFSYTQRLLQAMSNQRLESSPETTPFLVLPLVKSFTPKHRAKESDVDWNEVQRPDEHEPLTKDPSELGDQLDDAILAFGDFNRKFTAAPAGLNEEGKLLLRTYQFCSARKGGVVASLTKKLDSEVRPARDLHKTSVSASALRMATLLPALIARLDDWLIASEASTMLGGTIPPALVLEAICPPGTRTAQDATQLGHENYERLEILGDTLLKLFATLDVFDLAKSEGAMTRQRHGCVSNRALKAATAKSGIVPFIRSKRRKVHDIVPPGWIAKPLVSTEQYQEEQASGSKDLRIGDKTIADVAEALLGAAYLSAEGGDDAKLQAALDIAHKLCIPLKMKRFPVRHVEATATTLKDYQFRDASTAEVIACPRKDPKSFARFQMFEFLGDAVIDYFTMTHLWSAHSDAAPAKLTIMKHSRVSNAAFGAWASTIGLHNKIKVDDSSQEQRMAQFAAQVSHALRRIEKQRVEGKIVDEFWSQVPEFKFMGDILEAQIGAIYHDCGDLSLLRELFEPARAWIDKFALNPTGNNSKPHPKSALIEQLAKAHCNDWSIDKVDPSVVISSGGGKDSAGESDVADSKAPSSKAAHGAQVVVHGIVLAAAVGRTPPIAQRAACEIGLQRLEKWDWKICTCHSEKEKEKAAIVDASPASSSPGKRARDAGADSAHPAVAVDQLQPSKKKKKSHSPQEA